MRTDQPGIAEGPADLKSLPERPGDRDELRQRLQRLPPGHPSSPLEADGTPRPPEPGLACRERSDSGGTDEADRQPLTDAEWAEFAAQTIAPKFPDGFTVFDEEGQWRNPQTGQIAHGRTKILLVAAKPEPDLSGRLSAVIDAYKAQFHQQSVGIVTSTACGQF